MAARLLLPVTLARTDEVIRAVVAEIEAFRSFIDASDHYGLRSVVIEVILQAGGGRPRAVVVRPEVRRNLLTCQEDPA